MSALIVFVSTPNEEVAKLIARELLDAKLAACVSLQAPMLSLYHWENEIKEDNEIVLIIKSNEESFKEMETLIKSHHPYHVPEIIASPITHGNSDYLTWIDKILTKEY